MAGVEAAVRADGDTAVRVQVRVTPRAAHSEIVGLHGSALRVRLAAPPVDDKANAALLALLAQRLGVRRSACEIVRGARGRDKSVRIRGVDVHQAARRLAP